MVNLAKDTKDDGTDAKKIIRRGKTSESVLINIVQ